MPHVDTLIHASWIAPVEPGPDVLADHALAIEAGRIVAVLPSGEADAGYTADHVHRLDGHLLIPGLVNAHTHAAMTLFRSWAGDLQLQSGLFAVPATIVRQGGGAAAVAVLDRTGAHVELGAGWIWASPGDGQPTAVHVALPTALASVAPGATALTVVEPGGTCFVFVADGTVELRRPDGIATLGRGSIAMLAADGGAQVDQASDAELAADPIVAENLALDAEL